MKEGGVVEDDGGERLTLVLFDNRRESEKREATCAVKSGSIYNTSHVLDCQEMDGLGLCMENLTGASFCNLDMAQWLNIIVWSWGVAKPHFSPSLGTG